MSNGYGPLQAANAPSPVQGKSEFNSLAERFEKAVVQLREEVFALNTRFGQALRPEEPVPTGSDCCKGPVRSSLENFLLSQFSVIQSCTERIRDYDKRCCF